MPARKVPPGPVIILGWYGSDNTGDEAVLRAVIEALRQRDFTNLHVLSTNPTRTARQLGVESSPRTPSITTLRTMRSGSALVLGGGGLIQDGTSVYNLPVYAFYVGIARLFGLKVVGWGLGVEPLWTAFGKGLARFIVRSSAHFSVRDTISLAILHRAGIRPGEVKVTADPAFLIEPDEKTSTELGSRPKIVFCIRHLSDNHPGINLHYLLPVSVRKRLGIGWRPPQERHARFIEVLARGIKLCIYEFGANVELLPLWPGRDDVMLEEVKAAAVLLGAPANGVSYAETGPLPEQVAAYVGTADLLVSMRLHALIFGARQGVPLLALSYAHKVRGLMRMLGMERWVVEVETRTPPPEELEMKLRLLWTNRYDETRRLKAVGDTAYRRAIADADEIARALRD